MDNGNVFYVFAVLLSWLDDGGKVKMGTRPVHMNTLTNHVQPIPPKKRVY